MLCAFVRQLLGFARGYIQVGDDAGVGNDAEYLGQDLAAVGGRFVSAQDGDGREYAEEGAAGDKSGGYQCAAVAATTADFFVFGRTSYKPRD